MENKKIDIFKYLIPVVAVVIIIESIMVVSGLMKKDSDDRVDTSSYVFEDSTQTTNKVVEDEGNPKANFVFSVDSTDMQVGQSYTIQLDMLPKESFSADAVDIYVSYDSTAFDVSGLKEGSDMPTATSMRVSDKRNIVLANFWFTETEGVAFEAEKPVNVLSFVVTPKTSGSYEFGLNRQDSELGISRIVTAGENSDQVSSLSFSSDKLTVIIN